MSYFGFNYTFMIWINLQVNNFFLVSTYLSPAKKWRITMFILIYFFKNTKLD